MPTGYTPVYQIMKDGVDVTGHFNDRTTSIKIDLVDGGGQGDICTITLDDRDWKIARPNVGDKIEVRLGYKEVGMTIMGQFELVKVVFSGLPKSITLMGHSTGFLNVLKSPKVQSFDNQTLGEIFNKLGGDAGVPVLVHPDLRDKKIPFKNQFVSPNHLIQELERNFNATAKLMYGQLVVIPKDKGSSVSGQTLPIVILGPAHFGTWAVTHTSRSSFTKSRAAYFDKTDNIKKFVEALNPRTDVQGKSQFDIGQVFNSQEEAQAAADSQMAALNRSLGIAELTLAKGDPWIRDDQRILIQNMRDGVNGSYVARLVSHSYSKEAGLQTAMRCEPPGNGADYESQYEAATDEEKKQNFLNPAPGAVVGTVIPPGEQISV